MGDKQKKGGVDKDDFMALMRELGLIGKNKDQHAREQLEMNLDGSIPVNQIVEIGSVEASAQIHSQVIEQN